MIYTDKNLTVLNLSLDLIPRWVSETLGALGSTRPRIWNANIYYKDQIKTNFRPYLLPDLARPRILFDGWKTSC